MSFIKEAREIIQNDNYSNDEKRNKIWSVINNYNNNPPDKLTKIPANEIRRLYSRSMKVRREFRTMKPDIPQDVLLEITGFPLLTSMGNIKNANKNIDERQEMRYVPEYFTKPILIARILDRLPDEYETFEAMVDLMVILMLRGAEVKQIKIAKKNDNTYVATNLAKTKENEVRRIYCLYNLWKPALYMLDVIQKGIVEDKLPDLGSNNSTARRLMKIFVEKYNIESNITLSDLREIGALLYATTMKTGLSEDKIKKRKQKALRHKVGGVHEFSASLQYYNSFQAPQ